MSYVRFSWALFRFLPLTLTMSTPKLFQHWSQTPTVHCSCLPATWQLLCPVHWTTCQDSACSQH